MFRELSLNTISANLTELKFKKRLDSQIVLKQGQFK